MKFTLQESIIILGVFSLSAILTVSVVQTSWKLFHSMPYTERDSIADNKLSTLTDGRGASILDNIITKIDLKATGKAGNPFSVKIYNTHIDERLNLMDILDDDIRKELGSDYDFIFKYAYPRVLELKKKNGTTAILDRFGNLMETENMHSDQDISRSNMKASGILQFSQKNIPISPSGSRYSFDENNGDVKASWDIQNAEGCWLDPGYVKNGVAYTTKTNGWDFLNPESEEIIPLKAADGWKLYNINLVCGKKSVGWYNNHNQPLKSFFIDVVNNGDTSHTPGNAVEIKTAKVICAGNGWPASIDIEANNDFNVLAKKDGVFLRHISMVRDSSNNIVYVAQLNGDETSIEIYKSNDNNPILWIKTSECQSNTFHAKPEIISAIYHSADKELIVRTKNALTSDIIDINNDGAYGSLFWEKDGDNTYTAKLTDPYYKTLIPFIESWKSDLGIFGSFEPNYWRNGIRNKRYPITVELWQRDPMPTLVITRTCNEAICTTIKPGDMYGVSWKTTNSNKVSYICSWTTENIQTGHIIVVPNNMENSYTPYTTLISNGWTPGDYICTWTVVGNWWTITQKDQFSIGQ